MAFSQKHPIIFERIEDIKIELGFTSDTTFAHECGVTYPTYLAVKKSKKAGVHFLNGINALLIKR